ncbi:hypothetical protein SDC9_168837 [bioreactor metagenome]|uniref:Uncharacterized protein n=1 Tax=bioreactor metagenome TaxID=1076179 RepID=A0A645G3L6_9ZZZZ
MARTALAPSSTRPWSTSACVRAFASSCIPCSLNCKPKRAEISFAPRNSSRNCCCMRSAIDCSISCFIRLFPPVRTECMPNRPAVQVLKKSPKCAIVTSEKELQLFAALLFLLYVYAILCYTPSYETGFTKAKYHLEPLDAMR